jgi:prephenate dehydratase
MIIPDNRNNTVAFQGEIGAFSHQVCSATFPSMEVLPCASFHDVIAAVESYKADCAVLPIENSIYGRIADMHKILRTSQLFIIGEYFLPICLNLIAAHGRKTSDITEACSHPVALGQCKNFLKQYNIKPVEAVDTAGAARQLSESPNKNRGVIAPELAAKVYGLSILNSNIEDASHNTTRFLFMARKILELEQNKDVITTIIFQTRNIPSALYKTLGGFATNGINIVKLESYMIETGFYSAQFYVDIEGNPACKNMQLAIDEAKFFSSNLKIIGVYPKHKFRSEWSQSSS